MKKVERNTQNIISAKIFSEIQEKQGLSLNKTLAIAPDMRML